MSLLHMQRIPKICRVKIAREIVHYSLTLICFTKSQMYVRLIYFSPLLNILQASFGPPFALIQGTLEAQGEPFNKIQTEHCPNIRRGSVAWVGSGPEFFISLANHEEWRNAYTVFGFVLPEDMVIAEKIAQLPTKPDVWNNVNVSVLENTVPLKIQRIKNLSAD